MEVLEKADSLIKQALKAGDVGDLAAIWLTASASFQQGESPVLNCTIQVPNDDNYYGDRLNIFCSSRLVAAVAANTDRSFRPYDPTFAFIPKQVNQTAYSLLNFSYELLTPFGPYQNAPINGLFSYSHRADIANGDGPFGSGAAFTGQDINYTAWIGGMDFVVPMFLPKASSLTVLITPVFSVPTASASYKREFKMTVVLTGSKLLRSI